MADRAVLLFTKPAVAGRVKTRLIGLLSPAEAAALHGAFLGDLVDELRRVPADLFVFWGLEPGESVPQRPPGGRRQNGGDLGERLLAAFREVASTHRHAVAVGSDHPDLPGERVVEAFAALAGGADLALGPAHDGGYYLIGGRPGDIPAELFIDVAWSTRKVFEDTVERARELGLALARLPPGEDVDTPEDLRRFVRRLRRGPENSCPRTRRVLGEIAALEGAACAS